MKITTPDYLSVEEARTFMNIQRAISELAAGFDPETPWNKLLMRVMRFDSYYGYSDDINVWRAGKAAEAQLISDLTAYEGPEKSEVVDRYAEGDCAALLYLSGSKAQEFWEDNEWRLCTVSSLQRRGRLGLALAGCSSEEYRALHAVAETLETLLALPGYDNRVFWTNDIRPQSRRFQDDVRRLGYTSYKVVAQPKQHFDELRNFVEKNHDVIERILFSAEFGGELKCLFKGNVVKLDRLFVPSTAYRFTPPYGDEWYIISRYNAGNSIVFKRRHRDADSNN